MLVQNKINFIKGITENKLSCLITQSPCKSEDKDNARIQRLNVYFAFSGLFTLNTGGIIKMFPVLSLILIKAEQGDPIGKQQRYSQSDRRAETCMMLLTPSQLKNVSGGRPDFHLFAAAVRGMLSASVLLTISRLLLFLLVQTRKETNGSPNAEGHSPVGQPAPLAVATGLCISDYHCSDTQL